MALNIKDRETERLAAEVAALTGESKIRAVKVALQERRARLVGHGGARTTHADLMRCLETEVWPPSPADRVGTENEQTGTGAHSRAGAAGRLIADSSALVALDTSCRNSRFSQ